MAEAVGALPRASGPRRLCMAWDRRRRRDVLGARPRSTHSPSKTERSRNRSDFRAQCTVNAQSNSHEEREPTH